MGSSLSQIKGWELINDQNTKVGFFTSTSLPHGKDFDPKFSGTCEDEDKTENLETVTVPLSNPIGQPPTLWCISFRVNKVGS